MSKILERIARECGIEDLVDVLADRLPRSDLQSLLLEVFRRRAARVGPGEVLDRFAESRFVRPSDVPPERFQDFDLFAVSLLPPGFCGVELAPVCPLGTNNAVAPVDPAWSVATVRNTELVSDSTNVLALECALERRALLSKDPRSLERVKRWASHRLLRSQAFERPELRAHFRIFALCSAGRTQGNEAFTTESLTEHLGFYLRLLTRGREQNLSFPSLQVKLTLLEEGALADRVERQVIGPLRTRHPTVRFSFDPDRTAGTGYYRRLCFFVSAVTPDGRTFDLVDGGLTDWTATLLANQKERLLTSCIGSELALGNFGAQDA